jgi:hypothetical protein
VTALIALAALAVFTAGVTTGILGVLTVATRREETSLTLTRDAPGHLTQTARRLNGAYARAPRRTSAAHRRAAPI